MYCGSGSSAGALCPLGTFRGIKSGQVVADCATCTGGYCPTLGTIAPTVCPIYTVATPGATSKLGCRCQVSVAYLMLVHESA